MTPQDLYQNNENSLSYPSKREGSLLFTPLQKVSPLTTYFGITSDVSSLSSDLTEDYRSDLVINLVEP